MLPFATEQSLADGLILLQAELEKAKAASVPLDSVVDLDDYEPVKQSFCNTGDDTEATCEPTRPKEPATPAVDLLDVKATEAIALEAAPSEAPPPAVQSSNKFLGYILDLLIIGLVLDGLRRWCQGKAGAAPEPESWDHLMQAALSGDAARCERLLKSAPTIAGSDLWGCTVLHAASKGGSIPIVKKLLEHGALVNEPDSWEDTPLHIAARAGHAEICELLLAHGAPIDAVNASEHTPLVVAADAGHEGVCNFLLGRGAGVAGLRRGALPKLLVSLLDILEPGFLLAAEPEPLYPRDQEELEELDEDDAAPEDD